MRSQIAFTIDPTLKKIASARAKQEGIPLKSIMVLFLQSYAKGEMNLGFTTQVDDIIETKKDKLAYEKAMKDYKAGKNISSFEDFRKKLHSGTTK